MISISRRKIGIVTQKLKILLILFFLIKKKSNVVGLINSYIFAN
jgi:hypothetical protein